MPLKKRVGVRGRVIRSQGREIIYNVKKFMEQEHANGITIPFDRIRERVTAATGISNSTYSRISRESWPIESGASSSFVSPKRTRQKKKSVIDAVSTVDIMEIKNIIYNFYLTEKRTPTLNCLLQKIKDEELSFTGSKWSLGRLCKKIGFRWQKTKDNRSVLMEKYDIRLKRIEYLTAMKHYRAEKRNVIYTDETYLHSSHSTPKGWYDETCKGLKSPVAKGKRLCIVHAGGEKGFVPNGLLIFKSGTKSGDYHDDMNQENFLKWVTYQLIPNIPPRSVLVLDNASYHNVKVERGVTSSDRKAEMIKWLEERGIEIDERITKPEIYSLIKDMKNTEITKYKLDELMKSHGHEVLRLPPYHPDLNPIEKIWATVKNWVAQHNVTFKMEDVERLAREKFSAVTEDEWINVCNHVKKHEEELMEKENIVDRHFENFTFSVNTGSSDESWSCLSDNESDNDLSGIEALEDPY